MNRQDIHDMEVAMHQQNQRENAPVIPLIDQELHALEQGYYIDYKESPELYQDIEMPDAESYKPRDF